MWIFLLFSIVRVLHANCKNPNKYEEKNSSMHSTMNSWVCFTLLWPPSPPALPRTLHKLPTSGFCICDSFCLGFCSLDIWGACPLLPHFLQFSSSDLRKASRNHSHSYTRSNAIALYSPYHAALFFIASFSTERAYMSCPDPWLVSSRLGIHLGCLAAGWVLVTSAALLY